MEVGRDELQKGPEEMEGKIKEIRKISLKNNDE
jgi:hypothetical protein